MGLIMKRFPVTIGLLLIAFAGTWGCSDKKAEDQTKVPLEVKKAESMDSTRLDSALADTAVPDSGFLEATEE